jgi:hypothetical protein
MGAYKEDVEEIIFRLRGDISDLSEKLAKYTEKTEDEIELKQKDIKLLEQVAEELEERPPGPLFDQTPESPAVLEEGPSEDTLAGAVIGAEESPESDVSEEEIS